MPHNETPCLKCSGKMQPGFIIDRFDNTHRVVSMWAEGAPQKTFWTGLSLKGRRTIEVQTLRCDKCGFLESYAR